VFTSCELELGTVREQHALLQQPLKRTLFSDPFEMGEITVTYLCGMSRLRIVTAASRVPQRAFSGWATPLTFKMIVRVWVSDWLAAKVARINSATSVQAL